MTQKLELSLNLTLDQADRLQDILYAYNDRGPEGSGWQSPELEALRDVVEAEIAFRKEMLAEARGRG